MNEKAHVIDRRYGKQCAICMLIDSDNKNIKWHIYKEGFLEEDDKYICDGCLEGLKEIRKKCHQKVDNPSHKIFEGFFPWFAKDIPGLVEAFKK